MSCGSGVQTRSVQCSEGPISDSMEMPIIPCSLANKPPIKRPCSTGIVCPIYHDSGSEVSVRLVYKPNYQMPLINFLLSGWYRRFDTGSCISYSTTDSTISASSSEGWKVDWRPGRAFRSDVSVFATFIYAYDKIWLSRINSLCTIRGLRLSSRIHVFYIFL